MCVCVCVFKEARGKLSILSYLKSSNFGQNIIFLEKYVTYLNEKFTDSDM